LAAQLLYHQRMASLSINQHPPAAELPVWLPVLVAIDADGAIRSVESPDGLWPMVNRPVSAGSSYYSLVARICGENSARAEAVSAGIRAVSAGQADTFSVEFPCRLPDREMRMRLVATPYCQGAVEGVLLAHTDADAAQDPHEDSHAYKMEALGRLAGGVAHDFANLVTLISGYSDILLNRIGAQDPSRPELEEIRAAAARGAAVTAQILDFIRKQVAPPTIVELNALVAEMLRLLRPIIGEHISLAVTPDPRLGVVKADFAQMTRVIMNLVLNARDAMPRGGSIRIRTANIDGRAIAWHRLPPGRYVMLEVSDTGTGMDPETLRQVFQPFFTTKHRGGTGLGLSTVHRIVEQAGGEIWARSEPGRGTTFTVCLPRAGQDCEIADPHSLPRAPGAGTETILLVEDEESVRKLLRHLLDASGYRVIEAVDGRDALRLFAQHSASIDLLLTDVIMPGLNGRELAEQALVSKPGLKVIYMSGYTDDVLSSTGALGPGMSFLEKPLKLDLLSAHVREVLDAPALR
jgi:signal transduction histidine kinase